VFSHDLLPKTDKLKKGERVLLDRGVPSPDGAINAGDLIIIQKKILGLITF